MSKERSCYICNHWGICGARHDMSRFITRWVNWFNIDGKAAPGKAPGDLMDALGRCCTLYEERKDDEH